MERESKNTMDDSGKKLVGRKSDKTRRRIIEATRTLLLQGNYTTKITDIARAANIAQPHFYIYFSSIQDVVYVIAEEVFSENSGGFSVPPGSDWSGEQGFLLLRKAVEAGFAKWKENQGINSICLLLADREDGRFRELRVRRYKELGQIFVEKIRDAQQKGTLDSNVDPELRGLQCVNLLQNMAQQCDSLIALGFPVDKIIDETARFLISAVGEDK